MAEKPMHTAPSSSAANARRRVLFMRVRIAAARALGLAVVMVCGWRVVGIKLVCCLEELLLFVILSEAKNLVPCVQYWGWHQTQILSLGARFFASLRMTVRSWFFYPVHSCLRSF